MDTNSLVEKYEPKSFSELLLPADIREKLSICLDDALPIPTLLTGPTGTGKTLSARILRQDAYLLSCLKGCSSDELQALEKNAASMALDGRRKAFILDDVDHMAANHQPHLKFILDTFSKHNDFLMTAIEPFRIKESIRSRVNLIDFGFSESKSYRNQLVDWLRDIAIKECEADVEHREIAMLVMDSYPDIRAMLKKLEFDLFNQ